MPMIIRSHGGIFRLLIGESKWGWTNLNHVNGRSRQNFVLLWMKKHNSNCNIEQEEHGRTCSFSSSMQPAHYNQRTSPRELESSKCNGSMDSNHLRGMQHTAMADSVQYYTTAPQPKIESLAAGVCVCE